VDLLLVSLCTIYDIISAEFIISRGSVVSHYGNAV
jgi:hypothetical protein